MNTLSSSVGAPDAHTEFTVPGTARTYRVIREARAPKMGLRSTGQIVYQVLTDEDHKDVALRIFANEAGGYASNEAVSVHALVRCITDLDSDEVLRASTFKPAFAGRSANNAGFISAALLAEGLLSRNAERPHLLIDNGCWHEWCQTQLAVSGDLPTVRIGKEAAAVAEDLVADTDVNADVDADSNPDSDSDVAVDDPGEFPIGDDEPTERETSKPARKARKGRLVETE